jgi:hypothetical protein
MATPPDAFANSQSINAPDGASVATLHRCRLSAIQRIFSAQLLRIVPVIDIVKLRFVTLPHSLQIRRQFRGELLFERAFFRRQIRETVRN